MIHLAFADLFVIGLYFAAVLFVGYRTSAKEGSGEEDFFLAGRSLTLPVFVMTLVSTWYGGILGVGEFSYRYGISNWVMQGVPYYFFAALFAWLLAEKVRNTNFVSIPDKLEAAYDRKTAILGSFLTLILMTPAPYVLMLGVFLQMMFGWSLVVCLIVTAIVAVSYLFWGGFKSDVETDMLEFVLMFLGFAVIIPFCAIRYGGFEFLRMHLPPLHLTWHGGNSVQFILVWFFIALWTLVDPAFHQRCYAAKDGATARRGILVSIIFWMLFDCLTAAAGLYARAALPHLADPVQAYPMLAEAVLPPIAKGIFYVGMLATIMSTLNTLAFVSAQTLGRDIVVRLWSTRKSFSPDRLRVAKLNTRWTQVGLVVSFLGSITIAVMMPSVIQIWYTLGTIVVPGLLVPLVVSYFPRLSMSARFGFLTMLFGWIVSLSWLVAGHLGGRGGEYPFGVEPMYPGLFVAVAIWLVGFSRRIHEEKKGG